MRRTITVGTRDLYWFGPREASKSHTSSCYSCIVCIRRDCDYNVVMFMKESMITSGVLLAIYIRDQHALQVKESCPNRSLDAIWRYSFSNRVVVGLRVFADLESVVGKYENLGTVGMASALFI